MSSISIYDTNSFIIGAIHKQCFQDFEEFNPSLPLHWQVYYISLSKFTFAYISSPSLVNVVYEWSQRTNNVKDLQPTDIILDDAIDTVNDTCQPEPMNAEDPLFILYTSGSTGKAERICSFFYHIKISLAIIQNSIN